MLLALGKRHQLLVISFIILGLLLYGIFAIRIFGNRVKLTLTLLSVLIGLIFLLTRPLFRILQLFIVVLPLTHTLVIDIGFTVMPSYMVLILLTLIMFTSHELWYSKSPMDYAIFAFLGVSTLSLVQNILAPPPHVEFTEVMKYRGVWFRSLIQLALLYFYTLSYFYTVHLCGNDKRRLDAAIKTYIIVGIILSSYGIYQAFATQFDLPFRDIMTARRTGGAGYGTPFVNVEFANYRSAATLGEPLGFGHFLLSMLPLLLAFGGINKSYIDLENRRWMSFRILSFVLMLFLFALFMTRSRGALLGFGSSLVVLLMLLGPKHLPRFVVSISTSIIGLTIFYLLAVRYLGLSRDIMSVLRFSTPEYGDSVSSLDRMIDKGGQRYVFYFYLVPMLLAQHPILGVGIGNFSLHASRLTNTDIIFSPTGIWGTVLVENGILGFAVFCWMIFTYYRVMIRTLAKVRGTPWSAYIIGCLSCFTGLMVQYITWGSRLEVYIWFFIGISMSIVMCIERELKHDAAVVLSSDSK